MVIHVSAKLNISVQGTWATRNHLCEYASSECKQGATDLSLPAAEGDMSISSHVRSHYAA